LHQQACAQKFQPVRFNFRVMWMIEHEGTRNQQQRDDIVHT